MVLIKFSLLRRLTLEDPKKLLKVNKETKALLLRITT